MEEINMEGINIDKKKPLWWVLLVTFCMVFIYSIGSSPETDAYADNVNPNVVENFNGVISQGH